MTPLLSLVDDDLFLKHECPPGHPERPDRLRAARRGFAVVTEPGKVAPLDARDATLEELARVHSTDYLEELAEIRGQSGYLDADTFFSAQSYDAMVRAAGGAVALVDAVLDGRSRHGFGLLRPPGHHACPNRAMGFCSINNAAVAARHAQARGAAKVLVLDWDVHHGNGTEDVFWDDPSVLYVSLHQWPQYPGTGPREAAGSNAGKGFTVNVPLSAGADDAVYTAAFERIVLPVGVSFAPDLVLVSAGYDAHRRDPLGGMALTDMAYQVMTSQLRTSLPATTPFVFLLEGGYDLEGIERSVTATLRGLEGDVPEGLIALEPGAHERELSLAVDVQRRYWKL